MRPTNNWEEFLRRETERLNDVFCTRSQFVEVIREILEHSGCPLAGLQYQLECPAPFRSTSIGIDAPGAPDTHTVRISDNRSTACRISQWESRVSMPKPADLNSMLEKLFSSYWKPQLRTESAGQHDLKREAQAAELSQKTIETHFRKNSPCSALFCDLDNFGQVNKELGHPEGDRIIKEFSAILEETSLDVAVIFQSGGDEFVLLLPDGSAQDALLLAQKIKKAVTKHDFRASDTAIGVSIGLGSTDVDRDANTFQELRDRANFALNNFAKKPHKGLARFMSAPHGAALAQATRESEAEIISVESPIDEKSPTDETDRNLESIQYRLDFANCLVKSNLLSPSPFSNIWMNCLSQTVDIAIAQGRLTRDVPFHQVVREATESFFQWAKTEALSCSDSKINQISVGNLDTSASLSSLDSVFAIAHGVFRSVYMASLELASNATLQGTMDESPGENLDIAVSLLLNYDPGCANVSLSLDGGDILWTTDSSDEVSLEYPLGSAWIAANEKQPPPPSAARAILVQIGHDEPPIPLTLFSERLIVDDRPTRGGGLPDFWEASIAKLVANVVKNPNIVAVYVWGNQNHACRTVEKLRNLDVWENEGEEIASRTGTSVQNIRKAGIFLRDKIKFPNSKEDLVSDLSGLLLAPYAIMPISEPSSSQARFLARDLHLNEMSLSQSDGCIVGTIAEAYPVVLETVRKITGDAIITDQAGQKLHELVDFKVHLRNPTQNLVPTFYEKEESSLEEYFRESFLDETNLFGQKLKESNQLESVISHVVKVINDPSSEFATRRAILVIPHEIQLGRDLAPLGLVSIRLVLRFPRGRVRISYSYTWRTVEALVGFPYSLYGSVKYGQHLTNKIRNELRPEIAKQLEMGDVSYIAHSLHMFMDDYGQNIARKIVDEASL